MKPLKHVGMLLCSVWALAGCTGTVSSPQGQSNGSAGAPGGAAGSSAIGGTGTVPVDGGHEPLIPVAPAIANAIFDAVGVRIKDLPIKAEKIYLAMSGAISTRCATDC